MVLLAHRFNATDGGRVLGSPGTTRTTDLWSSRLTTRRASDRSPSLEHTTAQSYLLRHPSSTRCTARLTSEPFSSVFMTQAYFCRHVGFAKGIFVFFWMKWPSVILSSGIYVSSARRYTSCLVGASGLSGRAETRAM